MSNGAEYEPQIRAATAELASNFPLQADDVEGTLASVTSAAVELIRGVDHADVLLIDQGRFDSMAATAPIVEELDAIRQRFQEGPCLQAAMNDPVIRCIDLRDEPRFLNSPRQQQNWVSIACCPSSSTSTVEALARSTYSGAPRVHSLRKPRIDELLGRALGNDGLEHHGWACEVMSTPQAQPPVTSVAGLSTG
jgi:hypothetical protein